MTSLLFSASDDADIFDELAANVSLLPFVNKSKGNIVVHLLAHGPIAIRQPVLNATCSRHSKMDGSSNNETE